jgi:hypothetical protein
LKENEAKKDDKKIVRKERGGKKIFGILVRSWIVASVYEVRRRSSYEAARSTTGDTCSQAI